MKIRDVPQTGSVGDTVTYQSRYGLIRRRKVIPRDPRTAPQIDCRVAFQKARRRRVPDPGMSFFVGDMGFSILPGEEYRRVQRFASR